MCTATLVACLWLQCPAYAGLPVTLTQKLVAADGEAGDEFGFSVATDGITIAVGALSEDDNGTDAGAVYIFDHDGSQWVQRQKLLAPDGDEGDQFGQANVLNDVMVVGARRDEAAGTASGSAYVFRRDAPARFWAFEQKLVPAGAGSGDRCTATDLSRDLLALPCLGDDEAAPDAGALYVYRRDGAWLQSAKLIASGLAADDVFGGATLDPLAPDGPRLLAGSRSSDVAGVDAGAAWVFAQDALDTDLWTEQGLLLSSDLEAGDEYAARAAIAGDTLLVSAPEEAQAGPGAGAVYVFERDPAAVGGWREVGKLLGDDTGPGDNFGRGLALLAADVAVVGAPFNDGAGAIYLFRRDECGDGAWGQAARFAPADVAAGDLFGRQMSAGGGMLAVSAWRNDQVAEDAGAVYVLEVGQPLDSDEDGILDDRDNCINLGNADQRDSNGDGFGNRCDPDLDDNGVVAVSDLRLLIERLASGDADADLDGDGLVTVLDFRIARQFLFLPPGPSGPVECAS